MLLKIIYCLNVSFFKGCSDRPSFVTD